MSLKIIDPAMYYKSSINTMQKLLQWISQSNKAGFINVDTKRI